MCLAIPAKVLAVKEMKAIVDMMGNESTIRIDLHPEVQVGDCILVHAGFAIQVIDEQLARETTEIFREVVNVCDNR